MKAYERFLKYAVVRTPSDETSGTHPSSQFQFKLADMLAAELKEIGMQDVERTDNCYVYGFLPATPGYENKLRLGLVAHMDTVSDFCDHDIKPVLHENYDGENFELGNSGRHLTKEMFGYLPDLKGETLITTDGTTVLGADDKAGIAEIITVVDTVIKENIPHGKISVCFTPDEEIGEGADFFDVEKFGADYGYTMDGDVEGAIEYENFNAGSAVFKINGVNVHPGTSKDTMVNACLVAMELNGLLPEKEIPRETSGHEGFFHLEVIKGDVAHVEMEYLIRDHDAANYEARKALLLDVTKKINDKWGEGTAEVEIKDSYRNMLEVIEKNPVVLEIAREATKRAGVKVIEKPIRGGTDGATISFKGLPCPNLGTGGHAYHGPYEHITVEAMERATKICMQLVVIFSERDR